MKKLFLISIALAVLPAVVCSCAQKKREVDPPAVTEKPKQTVKSTKCDLPEPRFVVSETRQIRRSMNEKITKLYAAEDYNALTRMGKQIIKSNKQFPDGLYWLDTYRFYLSKPKLKSSKKDLESRRKQIVNWLKKEPNSVWANVALAGVDIAVWNRAYRPQQYLKQAEDALEKVKEDRDIFPGWYIAYLYQHTTRFVARDHLESEIKEFMNRQPEYDTIPIYGAYFLYAKRLGDKLNFEDFAKKVSDAKKGAEGDILYARIVWYVQTRVHSFINPEDFQGNQVDWNRVFRGYEALLEKFPDSEEVLNAYAKSAVLAKEEDLARKIFSKIGDRVDRDTWKNMKYFVNSRKWVFGDYDF